MRGKKTNRPTTPPSEDEEENFVGDPDQIFDELPQPFRLVDKTLRHIFDDAWEIIEGIEERKALKRSKAVLPLFDLGKELSEYNKTVCVCTVSDGRYLFLCYSTGLAVIDSLLGTTVAWFEDPGNSIVQISACCLQEGFYLISTLDNEGFAKLFCFTGDKILLVRTFNEQEGTSKQAVATQAEISQDGGYVGVGWEVPMKESWLDIYKVPKDAWVKEIEASVARSRKPTMVSTASDLDDSAVGDQLLKSSEEQDPVTGVSPPGSRPSSAQGGQNQPGLSAVSFTKPTAVLRVRPPAPVSPCAATNCSAALKATDSEGNVIGSGSSHVLTSQFFDSCDKTFHHLHKDELQYLKKDDEDLTSFPKIHFLTPGRLIPSGLESAPGKVNSLSVWWSGGTQLFIYSLVKTAKDLEHKPDIVWPHSEQVIISTVSECGSFMAMGLKTGTVVVWDVYRGSLLRVYPVTGKGQILVLCFLSASAVVLANNTEGNGTLTSMSSSLTNLVVSCDDGTFCLLQCGVALLAPAKPLVDRSALDTEVITKVVTMRQTPEVIVAVTKSRRITLYDVTSCTAICHVGLPVPFLLSSQWPCICADGKVLMLVGTQIDEENDDDLDIETAVPFSYPLQHFPALKRYWRGELVTTGPSSYKPTNTIDVRLHSLIQDRLLSQENRQLRLQQRWSQYQNELKNAQNNKQRRNHSTWLTAKSVTTA